MAWLGAIDDTYRKFIIIRLLDEKGLMHKICHAFVFAKIHSMSGVLTVVPIKIRLLPAVFNLPEYVSTEDRKEILRNKWRDFNVKPEVPEALQSDPVIVPYR